MHIYQYTSLLLLLLFGVSFIYGQHEDIPYQDVTQICQTCRCYTAQDSNATYHYALNCVNKNFEHILPRWPEEFNNKNSNVHLVATFSNNNISILQQLPRTEYSLTFACSHCGIEHLQAPTFMDVPNIRRLDLSWNALTSEELTPDVFRGPFRLSSYEPIGLEELNLGHNQLTNLNRRLFEHTPNLTKLILSYNQLKALDTNFVEALATVNLLQMLDLSYTGITTFPEATAKHLTSLRQLDLSGNNMIVVPTSLQHVGRSLQSLNLAGNKWQRLTSLSFIGLHALKRLNISYNNVLATIDNGTFAKLDSLERLECAYNSRLNQFDLNSLRNSSNLIFLDISNNQLSTLTFDLDLSTLLPHNSSTNATNITSEFLQLPPWPRLFMFTFHDNPWFCDCNFMLTLQYIQQNKSQLLQNNDKSRCDIPYVLAGARIANLTATRICDMPMVREYHVIDEDPPRFLRKDYIILTLIIASVVIVLGFIIGFLVVCIRRRLKRDDIGTEPIRYTSVRSSNLSAFNTNGHTNITATT